MTWAEILAELKNSPTVDIPTAGQALAGLSRSGSYIVAKEGRFPVPVIEVGGRRRVASMEILRKLALEESGPQPVQRRRQPQK